MAARRGKANVAGRGRQCLNRISTPHKKTPGNNPGKPMTSPHSSLREHGSKPVPLIAVVLTDTLAAMGLAELVRRLMPGAEVRIAGGVEELAAGGEVFFHFFTDACTLLSQAPFFWRGSHAPSCWFTATRRAACRRGSTRSTCGSEEELVRDFVRLAGRAHGARGSEPEAVRRARQGAGRAPQLTARETEVLQLVVKGHINKQIAALMGVSTATVISHRKNLAEKLGTKNVAALTIYAVAHGLVRAEDI